MKRLLKYTILFFSLFVLFSSNVFAEDDVLKTIDEAVNQYKNGDYTGAANNLDYASQLIRQKKSEKMLEVLPGPLPGWEAEAADAQALGTALFGGGINVSRTYTRNNAKVIIDIVADSPVMQSFIMMMNNPMLAGASGGKLETIKGQKAIVQYNETSGSGEVNVIVENAVLVTVRGQETERSEIMLYAKAIDYDALTGH